jgi:hypothetical protein
MAKTMNNSRKALTLLADLFFLWVLFHYGLGGYETAVLVFGAFGPLSWLLLGGVVFLLLFRSDYRTDVPLFLSGWLLGYWGEWWGTTRGVWWYWNEATPPDYLPPLWGLGLLTVYRLSQLILPLLPKELPRWQRWILGSGFVILPALMLGRSFHLLAPLDWRTWIDFHFIAGLVVAAGLILWRFELRQDFLIYLSGTLLGGLYEYLGTSMGEWTYITGETPPLWIAPLWGLAAVAMFRQAVLMREFVGRGWGKIKSCQKFPF